MKVFSISSVIPTIVPKVKSLLNMNTKNIVVKVATILQETAFIRLLRGFSILTHTYLTMLLIKQYKSIINFPLFKSSIA
jgi:hypothetical protein